MKQISDKLRILWIVLVEAYDRWKVTVWNHDLNEYYCCDGQDCNCDGMKIREVYLG
jgi:hypothetical protein